MSELCSNMLKSVSRLRGASVMDQICCLCRSVPAEDRASYRLIQITLKKPMVCQRPERTHAHHSRSTQEVTYCQCNANTHEQVINLYFLVRAFCRASSWQTARPAQT